MVLQPLCVVILIGALVQLHKLILLPQTETTRKKGNFGKYIVLFDEHLEIPSHRAAWREGGRENMPALIVYVGWGLHDRQSFSCPGHYSIK